MSQVSKVIFKTLMGKPYFFERNDFTKKKIMLQFMTFTAQWHVVKVDKGSFIILLSTMLGNCAVRLKNLSWSQKVRTKHKIIAAESMMNTLEWDKFFWTLWHHQEQENYGLFWFARMLRTWVVALNSFYLIFFGLFQF